MKRTEFLGQVDIIVALSLFLKKRFLAFALLAVFHISAQTVVASTHYVSYTANIEGDGSINAPFKTIGKAATVVGPGDTVLVSGGIYVEKNISPARSGKEDSMIVFKVRSNTGAVILRHPDVSYADSDNKGVFHLNQKSFIWIEGFRFSDFKYGKTSIQITEGEGNVVINNRFENLGNSGVAAWDQAVPGVNVLQSRNNVIRNNYFNNIHGDGITINSARASGNLVSENTFNNFQGKERSWAGPGQLFSRCIDIQETSKGDNVFAANLGTNNSRNFIWADRNGSRNILLRNKGYNGGAFVFTESRCSTNVVQENICYNMKIGYQTARYETGWTEGGRWISNVAFRCTTGFYCHKSGRDEFRNNIAFNNSEYNIVITDTALKQGPRIFKNNLWYTAGKPVSMMYGSESLSIADWRTRSGETGVLSQDPMFVSTADGAENFNLRQGSPGLQAGYEGVNMGAYANYPAGSVGWDSTLVFSKTLVSFDSVASTTRRGRQISIGVGLNRAATIPVSIQIIPVAGDAKKDADFRLENDIVTFFPGETRKLVSLTLIGSSEHEEIVAFGFANGKDCQPGARNIRLVRIMAGQATSSTYYSVNATAFPGGAVSQNPTGSRLTKGTTVNFTAVPNMDWKFVGWSGDFNGSGKSYTISSLDTNVILNASFLPNNPLLYEAEYAQRMHATTASSDNSGYSGTGYADFGGAGSFFELPVHAPDSGRKVVRITYANGGAVDRGLSVALNGTEVKNLLNFPVTGGWAQWKTVDLGLNLGQGISLIKMTAVAEAGGPNVDKLQLIAIPKSPAAPTLVSPDDGLGDQELILTLAWDSVGEANAYRLQVSKVKSFDTLVYDDSTLADTAHIFDKLSSATTYYWRVQARNAGGTSPWSEIRSFTTTSSSSLVPLEISLERLGHGQADFRFALPNRTHVQARLLDLRGKMSIVILNEVREAGVYHLAMPSMKKGVYILDFQAGDFSRKVKLRW